MSSSPAIPYLITAIANAILAIGFFVANQISKSKLQALITKPTRHTIFLNDPDRTELPPGTVLVHWVPEEVWPANTLRTSAKNRDTVSLAIGIPMLAIAFLFNPVGDLKLKQIVLVAALIFAAIATCIQRQDPKHGVAEKARSAIFGVATIAIIVANIGMMTLVMFNSGTSQTCSAVSQFHGTIASR